MLSEISAYISLDFLANLSSIVSLGVSGVTLFVSLRIRESVLKQIEKNDYLHDIDDQLAEIEAMRDTLLDNETPIDEKHIDLMLNKLEIFPITYTKILPKRIMNEIQALIDYLDQDYRKNIQSQECRRYAARKSHQIYLKLKKEKKTL